MSALTLSKLGRNLFRATVIGLLLALSAPGVSAVRAEDGAASCEAGKAPVEPGDVNVLVEAIRSREARRAPASVDANASVAGDSRAVQRLNGAGYNYGSGTALELHAFMELKREALQRAQAAAAAAAPAAD